MADPEVKTSGLDAAEPLDGTELVDVSQNVAGTLTSRKATTADIAALAGPGGGSLASARTRRTSGDITLNNSGSWADVTAAHDLVVSAAAGNVLQISLSVTGDSQAVEAYLDAVTMVSGTPTNHASGVGGATGRGVQAWTLQIGAIRFQGGTIQYVVQAGDIVSGNVTLRLRYRTHVAGNKIMSANATMPMHFSVVNLG